MTAVIPAYEAAPFVAVAIQSVLDQTVAVADCVVVDDGSRDRTAEIALAFGAPVRVFRQPNGGVSSARNTGINAARTEWVAFLDADDAWLPDKTARQLEALRRVPEAAAVYGGLVLADEALVAQADRPAPDPAEAISNVLMLRASVPSLAQTGIVSTAMLRRLGGFETSLSTSADADLFLRLAAAAPVVSVSTPVALYRRHGGQMHRDPVALERDVRLLLDRIFHSSTPPPQNVEGLERRARVALHRTLALSALSQGRERAAARHAILALVAHPPAACADLARAVLRQFGFAGTASMFADRR